MVQQQLILLIERHDHRFIAARRNLIAHEETRQKNADKKVMAMRLQKIHLFELWGHYSMLAAIVLVVFIFGGFVAHNFVSRAVLCDNPLCVNMRLDGKVQEIRKRSPH